MQNNTSVVINMEMAVNKIYKFQGDHNNFIFNTMFFKLKYLGRKEARFLSIFPSLITRQLLHYDIR